MFLSELLEFFFYTTSGVGILTIGDGIFRRVFRKRINPSLEEEESNPNIGPYRTNAFDGEMAIPSLGLKSPDIIEWAWRAHVSPQCHVCPKCTHYQRTGKQTVAIVPKICECPQYHKPHFHFECYACGYKAIMRTADDKEEKK